MLESESDLLSAGEDQLIEVVEDELEGLRVVFIDLYDLTNAAGVERLVLDVPEVAEDLLYLLLH